MTGLAAPVDGQLRSPATAPVPRQAHHFTGVPSEASAGVDRRPSAILPGSRAIARAAGATVSTVTEVAVVGVRAGVARCASVSVAVTLNALGPLCRDRREWHRHRRAVARDALARHERVGS